MKKKHFIILNLLFTQILFSQVGIGTTNPSNSSALEIKSSNSGLLIPRIVLNSTSDITTIPSPATSLLIYNTNTASDVTPGFYYWEGSWKKINNSAPAWELSGNTLSSGSEYLGTNNYYPLIFKVNNNQFAKFHPNGGIAIGNSSVANNNNSVAIGTSANASSSNQAIAIGYATTASGFQSTSLGLNANSSANSSVAIGNNSVASGFQSVSLGLNSSSNTNNALAIGNNSVASGYQSISLGLNANSNADSSVAIGNDSAASGYQSTAIGYQAHATQSNSIILGNSSNASNKIGIGTNTPDERLHVAGSIKIVDGTQANNFVLTSDYNGKASWKDPNASKSFGEIYRASNLNLTAGAVNFGSNGISNSISLNPNYIQVFTDGIYKITYTISLKKNSGALNNVEFYLGIWGTEIPGSRTVATVNNGESRTVSITKLFSLTAWQAISVYSNTADSTISVLGNGSNLIVELVL
ncbi:hypothetical protein [Flavobacterium sp.]|uniref:hypothetical protein n=1 Tax=Flavobacterium sp. TaxID=239 RepID=UPI0038FC55DC